MNIKVSGQNIELTEGLKDKVNERLAKLERYFTSEVDAQVTLKVQKLDQIVEVTIPMKGTILRTEVKDRDMYTSIDTATEKLEKQLKKFRSKLKNKHKNDNVFVEEFMAQEYDNNDDMVISRRKTFELKTMNDQEAIMQMNLLEHDFFMYNDENSHAVKVAYRKADGTYGVITAQ